MKTIDFEQRETLKRYQKSKTQTKNKNIVLLNDDELSERWRVFRREWSNFFKSKWIRTDIAWLREQCDKVHHTHTRNKMSARPTASTQWNNNNTITIIRVDIINAIKKNEPRRRESQQNLKFKWKYMNSDGAEIWWARYALYVRVRFATSTCKTS